MDCGGSAIYNTDEQKCWLKQLDSAAVRARASRLWEELDCLEDLCKEAEKDLVTAARKHPAPKIFQGVPGTGPIRAAVILGVAGTPHRFRTKKQFWNYCGLAVVTKTNSEYAMVDGHVVRSKKQPLVRGLNTNYNRALKAVFKGAALTAAKDQWKSYYDAMIKNGTDPSIAQVNIARKIAAITLSLWKKGERYDPTKIKMLQAVS